MWIRATPSSDGKRRSSGLPDVPQIEKYSIQLQFTVVHAQKKNDYPKSTYLTNLLILLGGACSLPPCFQHIQLCIEGRGVQYSLQNFDINISFSQNGNISPTILKKKTPLRWTAYRGPVLMFFDIASPPSPGANKKFEAKDITAFSIWKPSEMVSDIFISSNI